jgi:hypothetical protein
MLYLVFPSYNIDTLEPLVTDLSWLAVHGRPLYPDWNNGGDAYGMIYGPLLYFVNGVFLLLNPTIFMSKLPGVVAWLAAMWFFWRSLRNRGIDSYTAFLFVAVMCAALMPEQQYPYSNRADSYLLLLVSLTLVTMQWQHRPATWGVGVLAGLAAGFKLHGISYAVPAIFSLAARGETFVRRIGVLAAIGAVTAAVIVVIHANAAMVFGYVKYLAVASHHGLAMDILKDNARFALCYAMPPALLWVMRRPTIRREDVYLVAGLALSSLVNIVVGSKPGAGYHHLMPLIPVYLFVTAIFLQAPATYSFAPLKPELFVAIILCAAFLLFGHVGLHDLNVLRHEDVAGERSKMDELSGLVKKYPDAQIGIGDASHYPDTYYRPHAVFRGAYPHIDFTAWIDLAYGGVPESTVAWMVGAGCRIPAWILPGGEPFSTSNYYTRTAMFSDDFRNQFLANYRRAESGEYYQVWVCKSGA